MSEYPFCEICGKRFDKYEFVKLAQHILAEHGPPTKERR